MSTFTLTGLKTSSTDFGATTASIGATTLEIFLPDGAANSFTYTLDDSGSDTFPEVDDFLINAINALLDGVSVLDDSVATVGLGQIQWLGNSTTILEFFRESGTGQETSSFFVLGGVPLPNFASAAEFQNFADNIVTNIGPATGAFAPGATIQLADIPGVVESALPAFVPVILDGTDGDDDLSGDDGDDVLSGGSGNDHGTGGGGNDDLSGGDGDDDLFGGRGTDVLSGGRGNDDLSGGDGDDDMSGGDDDDNLSGGSGNDHMFGDDGNDDLSGDDGDDDMSGGLGDDSLSGGSGRNRLLGEGGNDTLQGGDDNDTLNGGDGDDVIIGGMTSADLRDLVFAGFGNDSVDGGYGNDDLNGMDGNDILVGGFGADKVVGGAGNDVITGSALSDLMFGNDGDDFINGGFGFDRVNGGAGADKFFHLGIEGHGSDWVQDFSNAEGDVLVFGQAGATADQFQVNQANTAGAGDAGVDEAFVIFKPTGQVLWALVDGAAQDQIMLQIAGSAETFDLLG